MKPGRELTAAVTAFLLAAALILFGPGCFTGRGGGYSIVVLTQDNPTMAYGIATIEAIAKVINRDLNPAATSRVPASEVSPSWGTPDEPIPAHVSAPSSSSLIPTKDAAVAGHEGSSGEGVVTWMSARSWPP